MYADLHNALVNGRKALDLVDRQWYEKTFIPVVAQRGAEIIKARGASSAASAANAAIDHVRDWVLGTREWRSMAIPTNGNLYNVPRDLIFSFPCTVENGQVRPVLGLAHDESAQRRIQVTTNELLSERREVENMLH